jgi:CNT family concentrative nucleoside transporter
MEYLRALFGLAVFIGIGYLFSSSRKSIDWRLVGSGLLLQIFFGLLIAEVGWFQAGFQWISEKFVTFLSFATKGTEFLVGDLALNSDVYPEAKHNLGFLFAFQALPIVIFFSAVTSALYYMGILQVIVKGIAWVMARTMRLSGAESLSAAGNIFLGQTEAPLLVKPFINGMTMSELNCLMTGGMATIAGSVLGAYVTFLGGGDPAEQARFATYLLSASIMNAPAAVVMSKLFMPELYKDQINSSLHVSKESIGVNILDAITNGVTDVLRLALNIGAMLLAFIAIIFAINWILVDGLGEATGLNAFVVSSTDGAFDGFSLQYILGQVFRLFAFLTGVEWAETVQVGSLIGQKFVINEFVAYLGLSEMKLAGSLSDKSVVIATYALCGFANFSSIAIQVGGIGSLAPGRQSDLSRLGFRALVAATLATMMTATIAGALLI